MLLWDDVSSFSPYWSVDDTTLARRSANLITVNEYFLGILVRTYTYWDVSLTADWTRVAVGDFSNGSILGINASYGDNGRYHEVYISSDNDGVSTFQLGSRAFYTVVHELGHSITVNHITGNRLQTIMNPSEPNSSLIWFPSTPMTLDIDAAIARYGATTTTRTGNDTYGFNARFSSGYREAFDFNVNTRPLVTIFDNGGIDALDASGFRDVLGNAIGVHVDLRQGVDHSSYLLGGGFQTFAVIYTTTSIENAVGGEGADQLVGNEVDNTLTGNSGADSFQGLGGNDTIFGGTGMDSAAYGSARSAYRLARSMDGAITVQGRGAGASDGVDTLYLVERLAFADGSWELYQLGLDDYAGNAQTLGKVSLGGSRIGNIEQEGDRDWFSVSLAADTAIVLDLRGSAGSLSDPDMRVYNAVGVLLWQDDDSGAGLDSKLVLSPESSGTYYIEAEAYGDDEIGTYLVSLSSAFTVGDDNVTASAPGGDWNALDGNDTVRGSFGDDTIDGGAGNDSIDGRAGADLMTGGSGNDSYYVDNAADQVIEVAGGGTDTVYTSVNFSLGAGQEIEYLRVNGLAGLTLTGNELGNSLVGGAGNDGFDGRAGADAMTGGSGNDSYYVDNAADQVIEAADGGSDSVYASVNFSLGAGQEIEYLRIKGSAALSLTGNEFDNNFFGGARGDAFYGGAGNDWFDGRAGADAMTGGSGNDSYYVDNAADQVIEAAGDGIDTVYTSVDFSLGAGQEIEYLRVNGLAGLTLAGNELGNSLLGGAGDDTLNGGAGNDLLDGGGGTSDDTASYAGAAAGIVVSLAIQTAQDTVGAGEDTLLDIENLNGSSYDDTLIGNGENNELAGGDGNDTLNGGGGDDILDGGGGTDIASYAGAPDGIFATLFGPNPGASDGAGGHDTLINIESIRGSSFDDIIGGDDNDNQLYGRAGDDWLLGGIGNDTLDGGGGGTDTVGYGDAPGVTVSLAVRGPQDTVSAGMDTLIDIENLSGSGGDDTLTGDNGNNFLYGDFGNDVLKAGRGNDQLAGGAGNDLLNGGAGNDSLQGDGGSDLFRFDTALSATTNIDDIVDYSVVDDTIVLENAIFSAFTATGIMAASAFYAGTEAHASSDRIIYDKTTGGLFYDSNGSAAGGSVQVANLSANLSLTYKDFLIT
jgi:Ca2+-binding RTX toxin-like protein